MRGVLGAKTRRLPILPIRTTGVFAVLERCFFQSVHSVHSVHRFPKSPYTHAGGETLRLAVHTVHTVHTLLPQPPSLGISPAGIEQPLESLSLPSRLLCQLQEQLVRESLLFPPHQPLGSSGLLLCQFVVEIVLRSHQGISSKSAIPGASSCWSRDSCHTLRRLSMPSA